MTHDERSPLSGLRSSEPPAELRASVLSAAREALAAEAERTVWDRIWESRVLRLAWVAATAGLLLGHVLVTIEPEGRTEAPAPETARADRVDDDLREIVRLPRVARIATDFEIAPEEAPTPARPTGPSTHGGES
jgi:hypothetical protein